MQPKPLETKYDYRAFTYTQVKRTGDVALFSVSYKGEDKPMHWEVILVRVNPGGLMFGKLVDPYERYPSDAEFGRLGWGFMSLEAAAARFDKLVKAEAAKLKAEEESVVSQTS